MPDDDPSSARKSAPREEAASVENGAAFPIVGIGPSTGGLEALRGLLGALPTDTGMGFVIISISRRSMPAVSPEILARATKMPVCEVRDHPPSSRITSMSSRRGAT